MKFFFVLLAALGASSVPASGRAWPSSHYTNLPHPAIRTPAVARQHGDSPWGGAVQEGQGWTMVTGTATVPTVSGQDPNAGAAVWVGIDGYSCQTSILQTGFTVWGDGRIETWYEWYPEQSYDYPVDLSVQPGHQLRMTVYADGTNGGNSTIENLSTGQSASQNFEGQAESLCLADAEWIVEDFLSGGGSVPFADFGQVQFTDAQASGGQGTVTPEGAIIVEVTVNGQPQTSCSSDASGVQCQYV
ncbi:proteinase aspergillopepsin II [Cordyceps fumosorosea ARSEF 2679]|uniref:Proteinase aspergillopepsin II n=1 Tax=Cordyceps fumosorosea (strain ARSEF 2679) TaxID=1081104 RepID=A0A162MD20_CORFA|nr:proteinase aspergillopepsin II [Cordyceps fumosorosea ARSEF 2679]OAA54390.1 proteinase aspergillopepsin II [Cordyceps fumosorosea ARSEF 2679]